MIEPTWQSGGVQLYLGDCVEILPQLPAGSIDAVVTDPPYPDYHADLYHPIPIDFLDKYKCRQLVFWSPKVEFPLSYTAIHIWDKKTGAASQYERIFERNGGKEYKVYRYYLINSKVAANYTGDEFTGHPSQKPIKLLRDLLLEYTNPNNLILDPFMGSGTTGVACVQTGRKFIGIEIDQKYFEMAVKRISNAQMQLRLDI